jgi:hypothetical protein
MADVTPEQARVVPDGTAHSIAAIYAHAHLAHDGVVNGFLRGGAPLFASTWAGKTGVEPPQMQITMEWSRSARVDLPALRQYGEAVMAATEAYLSGLTEPDLDALKDLSAYDLGQRSVGWMLNALVAGHLNNMAGELSCLKGLQGLRGYPF